MGVVALSELLWGHPLSHPLRPHDLRHLLAAPRYDLGVLLSYTFPIQLVFATFHPDLAQVLLHVLRRICEEVVVLQQWGLHGQFDVLSELFVG